jgi:DNA-binding transcriptional regulator YiaG
MAQVARTKTQSVRDQRKKLGLNQADFWRPLGVTQSGGSRYESGRNLPKPVRLLLTLAYGSAGESTKTLAKLRQATRK